MNSVTIMRTTLRERPHVVYAVLVVIVFGLLFANALTQRGSWEFVIDDPVAEASDGSQKPFYRVSFVHQEGLTPFVHASTITPLDGGNLLAVWYGGGREGGRDAALYSSVYLHDQGVWQEPKVLIDHEASQRQLRRFIKTIGNPVVWNDGQGRLWVYFVTVSIGGWAGSAVNVMYSDDNGESWSAARRLVTSPFLNVSTLVKTQPLAYTDGTIGLPVYHEFLGKFGELLRLGPQAKVLDKVRMSSGRYSLQPSIAPVSPQRAVALLRYSGKATRRILLTRTQDGGNAWRPSVATELPNPNAAVTVLPVGADRLLLVFNNTERDRYNLSLAESLDAGKTWRVLHAFENHPYARHRLRFSYPYIIQTGDGVFHVTYTWRKQRIKHVAFNEAWLAEQKKRLKP